MEKNEKTNANHLISASRISHFRVQGYDTGFTDEEISQHAIGNRFSHQLSTLLFAYGLFFNNIALLMVLIGIAFFSVVLPNHVFDYLYNITLRHWLKRPKLPKRPDQSKFYCSVATFGLAIIIYLLHNSVIVWGYAVGGVFLLVALLISVTDICIPSMVYNYLFRRGKQKPATENNNAAPADA